MLSRSRAPSHALAPSQSLAPHLGQGLLLLLLLLLLLALDPVAVRPRAREREAVRRAQHGGGRRRFFEGGLVLTGGVGRARVERQKREQKGVAA